MVLGAGWSRVAGRPLVGELFEDVPFAASAESQRLHARVHEEWRRWRDQHTNAFAEEFLSAMMGTSLWPYVVRYVGARLAEPDQVRLANELRYGERLDKPSPAAMHHRFIEAVLQKYELIGAVTTSTDEAANEARVLLRRYRWRPRSRSVHLLGTTQVDRHHRKRPTLQTAWIAELVSVSVGRHGAR